MVKQRPLRISVDLFGLESTELKGLDEDHLRAFLVCLRQFVMVGESVNFYSIYNLLYAGCESDDARKWIRHAREAWKGAFESSTGVSLDGRVFTANEIFDVLMYGGIVHSDPDNVAVLDSMPKQDHSLLRLMLLHQIYPATLHALLLVDQVIRHVEESRVDEIPAWVDE
jgi:hypothetical protein